MPGPGPEVPFRAKTETEGHTGGPEPVGLTSPALVLLLGVTVAVLLAVILLGWGRLAGQGARRVALRAAVLCALQASVLSLVFVLVNNSLVFYSSWADLVGSDTGGGT